MKKFITWLYTKYVLVPLAKEHGAAEITQELYVTFEPDPAWDAQLEKDTTNPELH